MTDGDGIPLTGTMVCDGTTARRVAWAMSRSGLLKRRTLLSFGFGSLALVGLSISEGYPLLGVLAVLALLGFVVVATYLGQARQSRVVFAEGLQVQAGTDGTAVRLRTGASDATHLLSSFDRADLTADVLLLHVRGANAHLAVPATLLTAQEMDGVQRSVRQGPATGADPSMRGGRSPKGAGSVEDPGSVRDGMAAAQPVDGDVTPPGHSVQVTEAMSRDLQRATLSHLMAPRRSLPLIVSLVCVVTAAGWALDRPWIGLAVALVTAAVVVFGSARQTSRSLRASLPVGSMVSVSAEAEGFLFTDARSSASIQLDSIRLAEQRGEAVLLRFGTNVVHVFPAAAFEPDLLERVLATGQQR